MNTQNHNSGKKNTGQKDAKQKQHRQQQIVLVGIGLALTVTVGLAGWALVNKLDKPIPKTEQVVQIHVVPQPPPPPPEEPPPPPPPEEEVEIPPPEQMPDMPDVADAPAQNLGLDAEGSAGSDAFGLAARRGGTELTGGGGDSHRWYAGQVRDQIDALLTKDDDVKGVTYKVALLLWLSLDGKLERYELLQSTGNSRLDQALQRALANVDRFKSAPPVGMPSPIRLRIESRS